MINSLFYKLVVLLREFELNRSSNPGTVGLLDTRSRRRVFILTNPKLAG